jgi:uncharacterized protein (UPF0264 family)
VPSRALSLKQPWAALLVHGLKTIEVRRWSTAHRGPLLIHAANVPDERPEAWAHVTEAVRPTTQLRGGILGVGTLLECKRYRNRESFLLDRPQHLNEPDWYDPAGLYGLCFADCRPLPFRPVSGWMRIFEVPDEEEGIEDRGSRIEDRGWRGARDGPGLLISVRSAVEVEPALAGGATLIDVKEPARGPLGGADEQTVRAVLQAVRGRVPVSQARGEYSKDPFFQETGGSLTLVPGCRFVKWGPAGMGSLDALRSAYERACAAVEPGDPSCQVVLVGYADASAAQAPRLEEVCALACQKPGCVLLIDTFRKQASGPARPNLLDAIPRQRLGVLLRLCRASGVRVALGGSLQKPQIEQLLPLQPDWFAVRGAACPDADRSRGVQEDLVRALAKLLLNRRDER